MLNTNDIFTLENGLLVINKDEVRGYPVFRAILERDKGSEGDAQGRKKLRAFKEFIYIWIVASMYSYPNKGGYNDKETHIEAVKMAQLEDGFKPDKLIKDAIEEYKRQQKIMTPTINSINTSLKGLRISDTIAQNIIASMESTIELQEVIKKKREESGEPVNLASELATNQGLIEQLNQVIEISNKLPKTIEVLEALEVRLAKEESAKAQVRGGRNKPNRADPKRDNDEL